MGASLTIYGVIPADEQYNKMLKAYHACQEAGVDPPQSVLAFFKDQTPDPAGMVVSLPNDKLSKDAIRAYDNDSCSGYEIDLHKLTKNIRFIRAVLCA